jgi:hypothetical protein
MAPVSIALALAGVASAGLLAGQALVLMAVARQGRRAIYAAKEALEAAERSAKASEEGLAVARALLDHTRYASELQLRAYLAVSNARILNPTSPRNRIVRVGFSNFGQTPAYNVSSWTFVEYGPYPLGDHKLLARPPTRPQRWEAFEPGRADAAEIQVGHAIAVEGMTGVFGFVEALDAAILAQVAAIYVSGEIAYESFGRRRRTHYRYVCVGEALKTGQLRAEPQGNSAD